MVPYYRITTKYALLYDLNPDRMSKQQFIESGYDPSKTNKVSGTYGLTQFTVKTGAYYGVRSGTSLKAIESQIRGQAEYLSDLRDEFDGDITLAYFAYHQGSSNVKKWLRGNDITTTKGRDYIHKIFNKKLPVNGNNYKLF